MSINVASRTNEKLYQARQLLGLLQSTQASAPSSRSLGNALLDSAVFAAYGAYLAFLLEVATVHHIKLNFIESLDQLAELLQQKGIAEHAVVELRALIASGDWPEQLRIWYRAGLGEDGWQSEAKPRKGNAIRLVDVDFARTGLALTPEDIAEVLEKLHVFIDVQREHLLEW